MAINAPFETACRPGCGTHRKPLTTGDVRSGERGIRCWILGSDWLEAILALPEPRFGNTGISTYVWGLNNRKEKRRRNKLRLASLHPTAWRSMWGGGIGHFSPATTPVRVTVFLAVLDPPWRVRQDSNLQPSDPKSEALSN